MEKPIKKVYLYITYGDRLLLLLHPGFPDAGIQVPAGTVNEGETFENAALREAFEETGLTDLYLAAELGEQIVDMSHYGINQVQHQKYFHLQLLKSPAETWQHIEVDPADGSGEITFSFEWAPYFDRIPDLIAEHGKMIPELINATRK